MDLNKIAEMADDEREAYRAGYLAKMASEGLTPSDADALLAGGNEKRAGVLDNALRFTGLSHLLGGSGLGTLASLPTAALIGIPVGLGGAVGWGLANARNPSKKDVELLEQDALADEYRHQTNALRGEVARANRRRRKPGRSIGL